MEKMLGNTAIGTEDLGRSIGSTECDTPATDGGKAKSVLSCMNFL
jgi:hypothetical protein